MAPHFRSSWLPLAAILAVAAMVRCEGLGQASYDFDQAFCWKMTTFPLREVAARAAADNHPPLYFYLLWFWSRAFGVLVLCGLAAAVVVPAVAKSRESARKRQCLDNLRAIGVALRQYHDARGSLPPAAVWDAGRTSELMLFNVGAIDRITRENWAQLLLPYLGRTDVAALFDRRQPVMAFANAKARTTPVAEFTCPADEFNISGNLYGFQPVLRGNKQR